MNKPLKKISAGMLALLCVSRSRRHLAVAVLGLFLVSAVLLGCGDSATQALSSDGRLRVVCTTTMIEDLAHQIAGDLVNIQGIMKPGEDPHTYEVRPRDAQRIKQADVVLFNGLHLEATLLHIIEKHKAGAIVQPLAQCDDIKPLSSEFTDAAPDPHCWFSVPYFQVYARRACEALVEADPANAEIYQQRTDAYVAQLEQLHQWVMRQVSLVPRKQRVMITSHDAFQYLGLVYDIDVFAVIGISTEQQPRPRDIADLKETVRKHNVKALFIESSVSATLNQIVKKVAASTGAKIGGTLYSDSLGLEGSGASTYIDMVRHNISTITQALR